MQKVDKKKEVKVPLQYYIDNSYFEGDLAKIIKFLKELPKKVKEYYATLPYNTINLQDIHRYEIEIDRGWNDDSNEFSIVGWRWETDKEVTKRLIANKRAKLALENKKRLDKETQEKRDLEEFQRLKAKYE